MQIVLASNNAGKLTELQALFAPLKVRLIAQGQFFNQEAPEPHCTFVENALEKARFASQKTGLAAIADDAGLCVDAFGGLPGVQTAHYCTQFGYEKSDANNVKTLLSELASHPEPSQRKAAMVSVLVGVRHPQDPEPLIAVGRVAVEIAPQPMGDGGFGFDPVLYLPELALTFAQMSTEQKNALSHRGRSSRKMLELLQKNWLYI